MKEKGFTLMEVLVALLILSVSLIPVLQGIASSGNLLRRAKSRALAVDKGSALIQEMWILKHKLMDSLNGEDELKLEGSWNTDSYTLHLEKIKPFEKEMEDQSLSYWRMEVHLKSKNTKLTLSTVLP